MLFLCSHLGILHGSPQSSPDLLRKIPGNRDQRSTPGIPTTTKVPTGDDFDRYNLALRIPNNCFLVAQIEPQLLKKVLRINDCIPPPGTFSLPTNFLLLLVLVLNNNISREYIPLILATILHRSFYHGWSYLGQR